MNERHKPMKRPYHPPRIEQLNTSTIGKHRVFDVLPSSEFDDSYDLEELMQRFGSPLFILSEKNLRNQFRGLLNLFSADGIDTRIAYSYKTNYLPAVCAVLHDEGALAEVVSGMEYQLARAIGIEGRDIVFNGPVKRDGELELAIREGALINLDGFDELDAVARVADRLEITARIGIRINFRYGTGSWTRFGFSHEAGESRRALERIARLPQLRLEALHNHSGTFLVDPRVYGRAAEVLLDNADRARSLGLKPHIIDFGGGLPSGNHLKPEWDVAGGSGVFDGERLRPFAEAILNPVLRRRDLLGERPMVMLEPGRAVVDAAMGLGCTVMGVKETAGQTRGVVVDAGVNVVPTARWYNHDVNPASSPLSGGKGKLQPANIYGPLCMQIDVVREQALLPELKAGDRLFISHVGAYCLTQSMQFIQPRPAVVMIGTQGPELVRRGETWQDIFALDRIPQRLVRKGSHWDDGS
jgi:diaminopimelate decarboxylase